MVPPASVTILFMVHLFRLRSLAAAARALARLARLRSWVLSVGPAKDGPSRLGKPSSGTQTTVCATRRMFRCSLQTACGVTITCFAGRIQLMAGPHVLAIRAAGPAQGELLSLRPSWLEFRPS